MKTVANTLAIIAITVVLAGCLVKPPTAGFNVIVHGFEAAFTDISSGNNATIIGWRWDFGDGETGTEQNPVHVYAAVGAYAVQLTVIDSRGNKGSVSVMVNIPGESGEGEGEPVTEGEGEPKAQSILGWVDTTADAALGGVKVTITGPGVNRIAYTDAHGLYSVEDGVTGNSAVVQFEKEGYVGSSVTVALLPDDMTTVNATLIEMAEPVVVNSDSGGEADDGTGNKLILPAGALVQREGAKAVTGDVDVHITPLDVTKTEDLAAFPGEFRALAAGKSTDTVQLETFALADFTVMQNGAELDLAPNKGESATIELVLPDTTSLTAGEVVPLWYFDEARGVWVEQGSGEVVLNKAGALVYRASVSHLSWWNCDKPVSETHCFTGIAVDGNGAPIANARIVAVGLDYGGSSFTTTAADGTFCIDVKRNSSVQIQLYLPGGNIVMDAQDVTAPDLPAQCLTGGCTALGEPLTPNLGACVSGVVKDELGVPIANATVRSSLGMTADTDGTGQFCMNVTPDARATFFVLGRPPITVTTPSAAGTCEEGGCLEISLVVEYPDDGDFVGMITATMMFYDSAHSLNASAMFAGLGPLESGLDPDPELGCDIYTFGSGTGSEGEGQLEEGEDTWDDSMNIPILDPGSPGEMASLTLTTPMRRVSEIFNEPDVRDYGVFVADFSDDYGVMELYEPGENLSFYWPGGFDIDEFSETIGLPGDPGEVSPINAEAVGIPFPLDQALAVTWTPGGSEYVTVQLGVSLDNESNGSYSLTFISCNAPDNGAYTIPLEMMSQLPQDGPDTNMTVWLNFSMNNADEILVPLVHGGQGRMLMTATCRKFGSWEEPALP